MTRETTIVGADGQPISYDELAATVRAFRAALDDAITHTGERVGDTGEGAAVWHRRGLMEARRMLGDFVAERAIKD